MGDGGILSRLGYKSMWPKLKEWRSTHSEFPTKILTFCCERRTPNGGKVWVGKFCSMAMAAHAFDLVAECYHWPERHYDRSALLMSKAEELRRALGNNPNADDRETRRKITKHGSSYASLFPCSDSRQTLLECFLLWTEAKRSGPECIILVERPFLSDDTEDRFYPHNLLPPVVIPESLRVKVTPSSRPLNTLTRLEPPEGSVLGTRDSQNAMDVEPDNVSCIIVEEPGAPENTSGVPCFHQQWTWCTRATKSDMHKRRWNPPLVPIPDSPATTFHTTPAFISGPPKDGRFSFLNFQVYHNLNLSYKGTGFKLFKWRGTKLVRYIPDQGAEAPLEQGVERTPV